MFQIFEKELIYLWNQSMQVFVLFVLVAGLCLFLRKASAHWRYLLWLVIIFKCILPPLVTLPLPVLPSEQIEDTEIIPMVSEVAPASEIPTIDVSLTPQEQVPVAVSEEIATPSPEKEPVSISKKAWAGITLTVGVLLFLSICAIRALKTELMLKKNRRKTSENFQREFFNIFDQMVPGKSPRIWFVDGIGQSFVWGFFRGDIYLPANFGETGPVEHRRGIITHELAHVVRWDASMNFLQVLVQALFFFHPLVWWVNKNIRKEREKCCDEVVIATLNTAPEQYSRAIVNSLITENDSRKPLPSLAIAGPVKNIEGRIRTIMKTNKKFHKRPTWKILITVAILAAMALPTSLILTARAEKNVENLDQPDTKTSITKNPVDAIVAAEFAYPTWGDPLVGLEYKFEPIHQGKNVVWVKVHNTSSKTQVLGVHIQTRSPEYGKHGMGWGTPFFDEIKPGETKWNRFVFKIQGPITEGTYIQLSFYNPDSVVSYNFDKYFYRKLFKSGELEKREIGDELQLASKKEKQLVFSAFSKIQDFVHAEEYDVVWNLFTVDYQAVEFQNRFEWMFVNAMKGVRPTTGFVWNRDEFLELQPQSVVKKEEALTLIATRDGKTWKLDFVREDRALKIDWIGGYAPHLLLDDERGLSNSNLRVIPKDGIGPVKFGMAKDQVVKILGEPEKIIDKGSSFIYASKGFSLGFSKQSYLSNFNCYTRKAVWPSLLKATDFEGVTDKGIKMGSSENEIVAAYGKPDKRSVKDKQVTLAYDKHGFYFWLLKDRLVQFSMFMTGKEFRDKIAAPSNLVVTPQVGINLVKFGMTKAEIIKRLGQPDKIDERTLYYSSKGFTLGLYPQGRLYSINCYTEKLAGPGLEITEGLKVKDFEGATDKGIRMRASEKEIIAAYGEPDKRNVSGPQVTLRYKNLGLWFDIEHDELLQFIARTYEKYTADNEKDKEFRDKIAAPSNLDYPKSKILSVRPAKSDFQAKLDEPIEVHLKDMPFKEIIRSISESINVVVEPGVMEKLENKTFSITLHDSSFKELIKHLCIKANVSFRIDQKAVVITPMN